MLISNFDKILRNSVTVVLFFLIGLFIFFRGIFAPFHNWDEIPYTYLASYRSCTQEHHKVHYQYLEDNVSSIRLENAALLSSPSISYRKRALIDENYFCQNLPFYTTKKLYISVVRAVNYFTKDSLYSVRLASLVPGILWYFLLGAAGVVFLPKSFLSHLVFLVALGRTGDEIIRLSTPDALGCFLITLSLVVFLASSFLSQSRSLVLHLTTTLFAAFIAGSAIAVRSNLLILIIALSLCFSCFLRRKVIILFTTASILVYLIWMKLLPNLLIGMPDSYSHLTLLMFHSGGLFGPSGDPSSNIRNVSMSDILINLSYYQSNIIAVLKSSMRSILAGLVQWIKVFLVQLFFFFTCRLFSLREFNFRFLVSNVSWNAFVLIGAGYLSQVALFPLADTRMISPYFSAFLILCVLVKSSNFVNLKLSVCPGK